MNTMIIEWGSEDYKKVVDLRDRTLRQPLGMSIYDDPLHEEKEYLHIAVFDDEHQLLASCQFKPINETTMQMKQVAVEPSYQGQHIGTYMFDESKKILKTRHITHINVHARHTALAFYQSIGFIESADPFLEVGILHHNMDYLLK